MTRPRRAPKARPLFPPDIPKHTPPPSLSHSRVTLLRRLAHSLVRALPFGTRRRRRRGARTLGRDIYRAARRPTAFLSSDRSRASPARARAALVLPVDKGRYASFVCPLKDESLTLLRPRARPLSRGFFFYLSLRAPITYSFCATGHGCWGVLLAPATGEAMAELIVTGASKLDLSPFSLSRFARR